MLLVALTGDVQQARARQGRQLTLHGTSARLRQRYHLIGIKTPLWCTKQHCQHTLAHLGKQGIGQTGGSKEWSIHTHNGVYRTLNGVASPITTALMGRSRKTLLLPWGDFSVNAAAHFPQESFNPTAKLNTGLPAAWSMRSATK